MKILSLTAITSTIGLTSLAMNLLNPSISRELKNSGIKLVSSYDHEGWKIKIKEYSESKGKEIENKLTLSPEELRKWCINNSRKSFNQKNKDLYEKVKKLCSRPKTMENYIVEKYKVSFLTNKDLDEWREKVKSYSEFWRITGIYDDISISENGKKILKKDMTISKLKIWCSHKKEEYYSISKTNEITLARWCTNYQY